MDKQKRVVTGSSRLLPVTVAIQWHAVMLQEVQNTQKLMKTYPAVFPITKAPNSTPPERTH